MTSLAGCNCASPCHPPIEVQTYQDFYYGSIGQCSNAATQEDLLCDPCRSARGQLCHCEGIRRWFAHALGDLPN